MEDERISYHESIRTMYQRIKQDGMTNMWDRYEAQGMGGNPDQRCSFCQGGVRCDLCSNGPCRADVAKDKRGVCGITGDGMAMRMMLLRNVMGASTYHYHTEQTIKTLKAAVNGKAPFAKGNRGSLLHLLSGLTFRHRFPTKKLPWHSVIMWKLILTGNMMSRVILWRHLPPRNEKRCGKSWVYFPGGFTAR